jgi:pentatricopeptide repeat protein
MDLLCLSETWLLPAYSILVKACGLRGDLSALDWVYNEMHSNPDWVNSTDQDRVKVYDTVLGVYAQKGLVSDALRVFQEIKRQGFEPDRVTYNILVSALGQQGQLAEAEKILAVMTREGCLPNVYSYIALMEAYVKAGELMKVEDTFRKIEGAGLEPAVTSYNLLMETYVRRGRFREAASLLTEMRKHERQPNATSYGILICARGSSATSAAATSAPDDGFLAPFHIVELYDEMREREAVGLLFPEARAHVIRAFCRCGRVAQAMELLGESTSFQGGEVDLAALWGGVVLACVEGGDAHRLPVAVERAVEAGWTLEAWQLPAFLKFLVENCAARGGERVLRALGKVEEGGLGRTVHDVLFLGDRKPGSWGVVSVETVADSSRGDVRGSAPESDGSESGSEVQKKEKETAAETVVKEGRDGLSENSNGVVGGVFGLELDNSLPSTAALEQIFDGLGLGGQQGTDSQQSPPGVRFRKSPVDVQWPQRRRVNFGGGSRGVSNGTAAGGGVEKGSVPPDGPAGTWSGAEGEDGFRSADEGTAETENGIGSGEGTERTAEGGLLEPSAKSPETSSEPVRQSIDVALESSSGDSFEQLFARLKRSLSDEELGSVRKSLVALASQYGSENSEQDMREHQDLGV